MLRWNFKLIGALAIILILIYMMNNLPEDHHDLASKVSAAHKGLLSPDSTDEQVSSNIKAVIVILIRNSELPSMLETLDVFERRFNHQYKYPFVFLNEVEFTSEFRTKINAALPDRKVQFGLIPTEHWSFPPWINQTLAKEKREAMERDQVIYGGSLPYRHMCRYQSGFFFRHPLLDEYEYYWRLEPGTRLLCNVPEDPFVRMQTQDAKYGFTIAIHEYMKTVPTLWKTTLNFMAEYKKMHPQWNPSLMRFFGNGNDPENGYNGHHFWSNFEIGSLKWLRSDAYVSYFNYLDREGGFFYERWGDAPVHSLAVGLFIERKEDVIWFEDIGYFHNPMEHCPSDKKKYADLQCECETDKIVTENGFSCVPDWRDYKPTPWYSSNWW
jgi:alpha 1,2-mannosyltransferase